MTKKTAILLGILLLVTNTFAADGPESKASAATGEPLTVTEPLLDRCSGNSCIAKPGSWNNELIRNERKWFYLSVVAHGAGTTADAITSWNQPETTSLLRDQAGRFGIKGLMIKEAIFAGTITLEYLVLKHYSPKWVVRTFTVVNFALGSEYSALAIHNRVVINRQAAR